MLLKNSIVSHVDSSGLLLDVNENGKRKTTDRSVCSAGTEVNKDRIVMNKDMVASSLWLD